MTTLIVNYQNDTDKQKFKSDNQSVLGRYNLVFVNDRNTNGVTVEMMKE